eukprot:Blabericola_migrator_1__1152@NODE_1298_length_4872_cov_29_794589_g873_i0_p2_GENE_NODE_1298_length_4872_cov_29_794589_g873_i0NODE_1298_length_4872_cov_29_794589_g873_i0_p2_ORF_typecomplete_len288_score38_39Ntox46/PF15538_6/0_12Ntox46/PF15538_6/1_4e03_NODE_1298_length_4872_cov_29_794589_g873_i039544817
MKSTSVQLSDQKSVKESVTQVLFFTLKAILPSDAGSHSSIDESTPVEIQTSSKGNRLQRKQSKGSFYTHNSNLWSCIKLSNRKPFDQSMYDKLTQLLRAMALKPCACSESCKRCFATISAIEDLLKSCNIVPLESFEALAQLLERECDDDEFHPEDIRTLQSRVLAIGKIYKLKAQTPDGGEREQWMEQISDAEAAYVDECRNFIGTLKEVERIGAEELEASDLKRLWPYMPRDITLAAWLYMLVTHCHDLPEEKEKAARALIVKFFDKACQFRKNHKRVLPYVDTN